MKKLKFNSTLNHKQSEHNTHEVIVEKVITLYGRSFSELKDHPLRDDPYIAENCDLMYIDVNDVAHCLLMVDYDSGDGILVESEGSNYARKSQFIPNARALVENNELTASERKLHNSLKKMVDHIAELAHCGENSFVFDELLEKSDLDLKSLLRDSVVTMLQEREDIKMAESHSIDVDFQPDITVKAKPTQELMLYCPLRIVREYDESDYEFDEEVIIDEQEEIFRYRGELAMKPLNHKEKKSILAIVILALVKAVLYLSNGSVCAIMCCQPQEPDIQNFLREGSL